MRKQFVSILGILVILVTAFGAAPTLVAQAASLPAPVQAVQAGGGPDWDKSSLSIEGSCDNGVATFTVTNTGSGDMAGGTTYDWSDEGGHSGSGSIPALDSGDSYTFTLSGDGKITVIVYQRPGHPGKGSAKADVDDCGTPPPPDPCDETTKVYVGDWSTPTVDPNDPSQLVSSITVNYVGSDGTICSTDTEYRYSDRPKCQWDDTLYADEAACKPPTGTKVYCLADGVTEVTLPEDQTPPEGATEGPCPPPPPEYVPYCTPEGETIWLEVGIDPPEGSVPGQCENPPPPVIVRVIHKAVCKILPCGELTWLDMNGGNTGWPVAWGTKEHRPVAERILENCYVDPENPNRCHQEKKVMAYGDCGDFDNVHDGVDFPAPQCHTGADGKSYVFWWNNVGEEDPHLTEDQNSKLLRAAGFSSWDGWYLTKDGQKVKSWYYGGPCCNSMSYAMTLQENGQNYVLRYPGVCQWAPVEFFVLTGWYPMPKNWAEWKYLFAQNLSWYEQYTKLKMGEKIPYPPKIDSIPSQ